MELHEWRRCNGVLWVSELLRADGRTPRRRYSGQLRAASGADEARLKRILFGPGRSEAGPTRRVSATLEAWTTVRVGDWLWRGSAINQVTNVGSGRVRARGSVRCDTEATNRVDFLPGELTDIAKDEAPLLVDTAEITKEGLYSMDAVEYSMMVDAACDSDSSSDESTSISRRTDMDGSGSASDIDVVGVASGAYEGCRDVESLTLLHQILPYGSQFRDTTSSAGHAWVNADTRDDD